MKVFITGAMGYLGTVLCSELLKRGHGIYGIDNLVYEQDYMSIHSSMRELSHQYQFEILDTRNSKEINKRLDFYKPDAVVHFGDLSSVYSCNHNPRYTHEVGVGATTDIITACLKRRIPFIYNSSSSVYGVHKGKNLATELDEIPEPTDLYTKTKLQIESYLSEIKGSSSQKSFVVFRPATVFGLSPRLRVELLPNHFCFSGVSRKLINVSNLNAHRAFVSISALCKIYADVLEANFFPGVVYNIAAYNMTKLQIALAVQEHTDCRIETVDDTGDLRNLRIDSSKFFRDFNQYSFPDFENEIKPVIDWMYTYCSAIEDNNFVGLLNMPLANWKAIL
jgi:nucleoside-diphosphate-sugar epimerase